MRWGGEGVNRDIYLDSAATARPFAAVGEAMEQAVATAYGNPSSRHGLGLAAARVVEESRSRLAGTIGATPREIVFTGGGSEANNLALKGAVWAYARSGSHLVVSAVEHPSVLETAGWLAGGGWRVTFVPVGRDGRADAGAVLAAVTGETVVVSLMHVNNEVGAIQPVAEVGRCLAAVRATSGRRKGLPLFHVDAAQSLGRLPIDVRAWGVDLLSLSAHKIHGPKGVGALFVREGVRLVPLVHGGGHEAGRRSGTENVPGIAGFGAALAKMAELVGTSERLSRLRSRLLSIVRDGRPEVVLLGPESGEAVAPHILCLSFPGVPAEVFQHHLERGGVYVSTGSACSSHHRGRASHVLEAMDCPSGVANSAIRLSLSPLTTQDEVEKAGKIIVATAGELAGEGTR
jgi:cysteine desulfurase